MHHKQIHHSIPAQTQEQGKEYSGRRREGEELEDSGNRMKRRRRRRRSRGLKDLCVDARRLHLEEGTIPTWMHVPQL